MKHVVVVVPKDGFRLYGAMVKKEVDHAKTGRGTWFRSGPKEKDKAKWAHSTYKGWVKLHRTEGEVITAMLQSRSESADQWQLLQAFLGFVDRHFGENISSIMIQYQE